MCSFDVIWFNVCSGNVLLLLCVLFFFKQKTAYEMRISDWSSDVCSSDLAVPRLDTTRFFSQGAWHEAPIVARDEIRPGEYVREIGRASCRERVCQYV